MKKIFLFIAIYILCTNIYGQSIDNSKSNIQHQIDNLKLKYAPDKRVAIFEVSINSDTLIGYVNDSDAHKDVSSISNKYNLINKVKLLPDLDLDIETYGVINLSVADIRTEAKFSAEMATQAILGTPIRIYQKNGWYRIQTPDEYIGWTQLSSFHPMSKEVFEKWNRAEKVIFADYFGFTYSEPDRNSQTVSDAVNGNIFKYEDDLGNFYKVSYPDGKIAYIQKSQSTLLSKWKSAITLTGESFVKESFKLMGIPYVWGGTSVKGMDCSGFTKTILFMHGIVLMRDASQQVNTGTPIDISNGYSNLKKGDLMFFGKKAEGGNKERIRHVGFYIGNNEFIHASGSIRISSLDPSKENYDEVNTKEFVKASRIVGAVDTKGIWSIDKNPFYN